MEIFAAEDAAARNHAHVEDYQLIPSKEHAGLQYALMSDDLLLRNGRFANRRVSELVNTVEGRDYIGQIWKTANAEVRAVIRKYFSV